VGRFHTSIYQKGMSEQESEYLKQFTGSAGANMIFVVGFLLYRALQNRCTKSKSKCATHCGWCDLEIENDGSSSDIEEGVTKYENTRSRVPQMQQSHDRKLSPRNQTTPPFDIRKIREPENWSLVDQTSTQEGFREITPLQKAIPFRRRAESL
jgi:hypothetical protein